MGSVFVQLALVAVVPALVAGLTLPMPWASLAGGTLALVAGVVVLRRALRRAEALSRLGRLD